MNRNVGHVTISDTFHEIVQQAFLRLVFFRETRRPTCRGKVGRTTSKRPHCSQIEASSHFPAPTDGVKSPFAIVPTSIALVGNVDGILDSAAGCRIIREDLIRNLPIEEPHIVENLVTFDRHRVSTRGFVRLTVRFKESVVELKRVRVVPGCIHEMILGIDWLYATGADMQFTPRGPVVTFTSLAQYLCKGSVLGERPSGILIYSRERATNHELEPRHVHFGDSIEKDSMSISLIQPEPFHGRERPVQSVEDICLPPEFHTHPSSFKSRRSMASGQSKFGLPTR